MLAFSCLSRTTLNNKAHWDLVFYLENTCKCGLAHCNLQLVFLTTRLTANKLVKYGNQELAMTSGLLRQHTMEPK